LWKNPKPQEFGASNLRQNASDGAVGVSIGKKESRVQADE
jgi:hypothetical protein